MEEPRGWGRTDREDERWTDASGAQGGAAHKAEHAVDPDTGAVIGGDPARCRPGRHEDAGGNAGRSGDGSEANRLELKQDPLRNRETEYAAGGAANRLLPPQAAKLHSHQSRRLGCQLNLVEVAPFGPLLRSSARHIRAPVVEGNLRNSLVAAGSLYSWQRC